MSICGTGNFINHLIILLEIMGCNSLGPTPTRLQGSCCFCVSFGTCDLSRTRGIDSTSQYLCLQALRSPGTVVHCKPCSGVRYHDLIIWPKWGSGSRIGHFVLPLCPSPQCGPAAGKRRRCLQFFRDSLLCSSGNSTIMAPTKAVTYDKNGAHITYDRSHAVFLKFFTRNILCLEGVGSSSDMYCATPLSSPVRSEM